MPVQWTNESYKAILISHSKEWLTTNNRKKSHPTRKDLMARVVADITKSARDAEVNAPSNLENVFHFATLCALIVLPYSQYFQRITTWFGNNAKAAVRDASDGEPIVSTSSKKPKEGGGYNMRTASSILFESRWDEIYKAVVKDPEVEAQYKEKYGDTATVPGLALYRTNTARTRLMDSLSETEKEDAKEHAHVLNSEPLSEERQRK